MLFVSAVKITSNSCINCLVDKFSNLSKIIVNCIMSARPPRGDVKDNGKTVTALGKIVAAQVGLDRW